jgi:hypothetical protein
VRSRGVCDLVVSVTTDRCFDYTDASGWDIWQHSPWRPANNVNYTAESSGLADTYRDHPSSDTQPFFHTVPGMKHYRKRYDLIRQYQERFVAKMLSSSLDYGHVLYCMNNETSTPAEWGQHWIEFIKDAARKKGVVVCTTDMFDDAFDADKAKHTPIIFKDPDHYMFADISQVNSRIYDDTHWERLELLLKLVNSHPRPTNHVKIYGGGYTSWGSGSPEDAVERFWRDILGGSAAVRFHRPGPDQKLSQRMWGSVQAARLLSDRINLWDLEPRMDLLLDRDDNEAYAAAKSGEAYAVYFTHGGSVGLNLSDAPGNYDLAWISVSEGVITDTTSAKLYGRTAKSIAGGQVVSLSTPYKGGWVAVISKK